MSLACLSSRPKLQSTSSTRQQEITTPSIIVDSREFKSSLPAALYSHGFQLLPVTLTICDYVLSSSIGVERKSYSDLVNSLTNGRLKKQMEHMCRTYEYPILLIEATKLRDTKDLKSKLMVLVRSFPRMRILWSQSDNDSSIVAHLRRLRSRCSRC